MTLKNLLYKAGVTPKSKQLNENISTMVNPISTYVESSSDMQALMSIMDENEPEKSPVNEKKWKYEIDVRDLWRQSDDMEISVFAKAMADRLEQFVKRYEQKDPDTTIGVEDMIDSLRSESKNEFFDEDEFDNIWNEIYDWADFHDVWIKTF